MLTLIIDTERGVTDKVCNHPTTPRLATENMNTGQEKVYILSNLAIRCGSGTGNIAGSATRLAF